MEIVQRGVSSAGLPDRVTSHQLRHFYASALIRHGESVVTVQHRLGHASADETLRTYAHLWPDSGDTTRDAISTAFERVPGTHEAERSRTDEHRADVSER